MKPVGKKKDILKASKKLHVGTVGFPNKEDKKGWSIPNRYDCKYCKKHGFKHKVRSVPHGRTNNDSWAGQGVPTTRTECSNCGRWSGPWISTDIIDPGL